jgi:hypothetical protein
MENYEYIAEVQKVKLDMPNDKPISKDYCKELLKPPIYFLPILDINNSKSDIYTSTSKNSQVVNNETTLKITEISNKDYLQFIEHEKFLYSKKKPIVGKIE